MLKAQIAIISIIVILLISSLLSIGPTFQTVKAETYFSDDFNDGVADGWTANLGPWSIVSIEYFTSVGIVSNAISTVNSLSLTDCVIETQLRFSDSVGYRTGIVFRYLDNEHYYSFEIGNEYDEIDIIKYSPMDAGYGESRAFIQPSFGNSSIIINPNVNYTLKVEVVGNTFTAYLNDQQVLTWSDDSYSSGLVGLRARRADVSFDNFKVYSYSAQPSATATPLPTPQNMVPEVPFGTLIASISMIVAFSIGLGIIKMKKKSVN